MKSEVNKNKVYKDSHDVLFGLEKALSASKFSYNLFKNNSLP